MHFRNKWTLRLEFGALSVVNLAVARVWGTPEGHSRRVMQSPQNRDYRFLDAEPPESNYRVCNTEPPESNYRVCKAEPPESNCRVCKAESYTR